MKPDRVYDFSGLVGGEIDPAIATALRLIEQQFKQLLLFSTMVALGTPTNGDKLDNLDARWCVHTFGAAANTDETLAHRLGRRPRGLINVETPLFQGVAPIVGTVSFGATAPSSSQVTLRCTAANKVATVILF